MPQFPAYKTQSVASLVPYARNSRTHSPQQVDKIAASIREFGFLNPIIVDGQNGIIAGHGRVLAGEASPAAKLSPARIAEALALRARGRSWAGIGRVLGVAPSTVRRACQGQTWRAAAQPQEVRRAA